MANMLLLKRLQPTMVTFSRSRGPEGVWKNRRSRTRIFRRCCGLRTKESRNHIGAIVGRIIGHRASAALRGDASQAANSSVRRH